MSEHLRVRGGDNVYVDLGSYGIHVIVNPQFYDVIYVGFNYEQGLQAFMIPADVVVTKVVLVDPRQPQGPTQLEETTVQQAVATRIIGDVVPEQMDREVENRHMKVDGGDVLFLDQGGVGISISVDENRQHYTVAYVGFNYDGGQIFPVVLASNIAVSQIVCPKCGYVVGSGNCDHCGYTDQMNLHETTIEHASSARIFRHAVPEGINEFYYAEEETPF